MVLQLLGERWELTARHGRAAFAHPAVPGPRDAAGPGLLPLLAGRRGRRRGRLAGNRAADRRRWRRRGGGALRAAPGPAHRRGDAHRRTCSRRPRCWWWSARRCWSSPSGCRWRSGAFIAGVLLADSEYRHELEADLEPFKGLLLGLFFIAVGMSVNLGVLVEAPLTVIAADGRAHGGQDGRVSIVAARVARPTAPRRGASASRWRAAASSPSCCFAVAGTGCWRARPRTCWCSPSRCPCCSRRC